MLKSISTLLVLLSLNVSIANAAPADPVSAILSHPVVLTIQKLLTEKNGGSCQPLTTNSVQLYCLGALPPISEDTIVPSGCGFSVHIQCANDKASIGGFYGSYFLIGPKPNNVKPVDGGIRFTGVQIN